jgi:hypothetical protein
MKAAGLFGGLFGGGVSVKKADEERPKPVYRDDEKTDRDDRDPLPIRTKDKSGKRKSKVVDGEGFTTDAGDIEADAEARRAERRAKREAREVAAREAEEADRAAREERRKARREREKADLEARREKERERARKEQEAEDQRREEKRAKRAERERRRAEEQEQISAEAEKRREERRKLRAQLEADKAIDPEVSKDERRRSYYATEDEDRQRRKEDRKSKDKSSKRKTTALMAEYHESRSGGRSQAKQSPNIDNTKTASWVNSVTDDPPEPPPLADTVFDPSGEKPRSAKEVDSREDDERRHRTDSRRHSKYAGMTDAEIDEHRARKRESRRAERESGQIKSASGASGGQPRISRTHVKRRDAYEEEYDPAYEKRRPSLVRGESKRSSFFGKLF